MSASSSNIVQYIYTTVSVGVQNTNPISTRNTNPITGNSNTVTGNTNPETGNSNPVSTQSRKTSACFTMSLQFNPRLKFYSTTKTSMKFVNLYRFCI
jgi:hypothetical protein